MPASVSLDKAQYKDDETITVTGAGLSATTSYVVKLTAGNQTRTQTVKTDGSGAFTHKTPAFGGDAGVTVECRPLTEHTGGTTATASATAKGRP